MPIHAAPPIPPAELKLRARFLKFIAAEDVAGRRIVISDWQINNMARIGYEANPVQRDVEVTHRRPVVEDTPAVTVTELRVLEQLPTDLDAASIAQLLGLTPGQVQRSTKRLYAQLDCGTRQGTVASAIRLGMLRWDGASWAAGRPQERPGPSRAGDSAPQSATEAPEALQAIPGAA